MAGIKKFTMAGAARLQWSYRSNAGYLTGSANLTAANVGLASGMADHRGLTSAPFALPENVRVTAEGDDGPIAVFQFGSSELPAFDLGVNVFDNLFYAATTRIAGVTDGDVEAFAVSTAVSNATLSLLLTAQVKSQTIGQVGAAGYVHLLLPSVNFAFKPAPFEGKTNTPFTYSLILNNVDTMPDGRTVASVFPDAPNGQMVAMYMTSDFYYTYSAFVGDNTIVAVPLVHPPVNTTKTKATVETTGFAAATVSSVDNALPGYTATLSAAPASGKFSIVRYEHTTITAN